MGIKDIVTEINTKLQGLKGNKLAPFAYESSAYDSDNASGTDTYDFSNPQNIPLPRADILQVNTTVLSKGFRSQVSTLPRMLLNHFFGRTSYNLNKLVDFVEYLTTSLASSFNKAGGVPTLDDEILLSVDQLPKGSFCYKGEWNAQTNTPQLVHGVGKKGDVYKVSHSGNQMLGGTEDIYYSANTFVFNTGDKWLVLGGGTGTVIKINNVQADNEGNLILKAEHIPYTTEKSVKQKIEEIETGTWEDTAIEETVKKLLRTYYPEENKKRINAYINPREPKNLTDEFPFVDNIEKIAAGTEDIQLGDFWLFMQDYSEDFVNAILRTEPSLTLSSYKSKGHSLAYNILDALKNIEEKRFDTLERSIGIMQDFVDNPSTTYDMENIRVALSNVISVCNVLPKELYFTTLFNFMYWKVADSFKEDSFIADVQAMAQFFPNLQASQDMLDFVYCLRYCIEKLSGWEVLDSVFDKSFKNSNMNLCSSIEQYDRLFYYPYQFLRANIRKLENEDTAQEFVNDFQDRYNVVVPYIITLCKLIFFTEAGSDRITILNNAKFFIREEHSPTIPIHNFFIVFAGYGACGEAQFFITYFGDVIGGENQEDFVSLDDWRNKFTSFVSQLGDETNLIKNMVETQNIKVDKEENFRAALRLAREGTFKTVAHLCTFDFGNMPPSTFKNFSFNTKGIFNRFIKNQSYFNFFCGFNYSTYDKLKFEGFTQTTQSTGENSFGNFISHPLLENRRALKDYLTKDIAQINKNYIMLYGCLSDIALGMVTTKVSTSDDESYRNTYNTAVLKLNALIKNTLKNIYIDIINVPITTTLHENEIFVTKLVGHTYTYKFTFLGSLPSIANGIFEPTFYLGEPYESFSVRRDAKRLDSFCFFVDTDKQEFVKEHAQYLIATEP